MQVRGRIGHHVTSEETTVARCLEKHFRLSDKEVGDLFRMGAIYSNKKRVFTDSNLPKGTYLRIHLQPKKFPIDQVDWSRVVVYETPDFLVINKPAGIPVHPTLDNQQDNLLHQLRERMNWNVLVTQRLDIPVGGLMVFAKTADFQRRFNFYLAERKVNKSYRALVQKELPVGLQIHFMEPSKTCPKKVSSTEHANWPRCELAILSCSPANGLFDLEIELYTGRTHQIRAQLSHLGGPILGDKMYGSKENRGDKIALFSHKLSFPNPRGPVWSFEHVPPWG